MRHLLEKLENSALRVLRRCDGEVDAVLQRTLARDHAAEEIEREKGEGGFDFVAVIVKSADLEEGEE
jgi:hypothetical protein